jgi:LysR family transcriptional regulator, regulator for bpeEF and oprC
MDKLRAMACYCRVVEAKSFSAAAQQLGVVPSALSKTVSALESELGFQLLKRSTRGLSLTDGGAAYYEQCRLILHDIEQAEALGRHGLAQARGWLRIGMHPALRSAMLSGLGELLNAQPELRVETVITNSPTAVIDDGLDLVLHIGALPDSSLQARPIAWARSLVCASPAYLAAWGEPQHPSDLAQHRAVIYARRDEESNTRWAFARGGESIEVDVPVRTVVRDGIGLVDAAVGGCGIARPSDFAAREALASGRLRELLCEWAGSRRAVSAVLPPRSRAAPAKVQVFLEYAAERLRPAT